MPQWAVGWLNRFGLSSFPEFKARMVEGVSKGSQVVIAQAISIGQTTFDLLCATLDFSDAEPVVRHAVAAHREAIAIMRGDVKETVLQ